MKIKIDKNDLLFFKSFLNRCDVNFVVNLNIRYEMDYLYGLGDQFIRKSKNLGVELTDFPDDMKNEIEAYIDKYGDIDDKIYYLNQKLAYLILCKYYNEDGSMKE